jgi:hypothetical protein
LTLEGEEEEVKEEEEVTAEEGKIGYYFKSKKGRLVVVLDRFVLRLEIRSSSSW